MFNLTVIISKTYCMYCSYFTMNRRKVVLWIYRDVNLLWHSVGNLVCISSFEGKHTLDTTVG